MDNVTCQSVWHLPAFMNKVLLEHTHLFNGLLLATMVTWRVVAIEV